MNKENNVIKKKIIISIIFIVFLLGIVVFLGMKSYAEANIVANEEKMVRMVAGLSRAKDSNNTINMSILQTELNNYVGSGLTTVVDGTDVITVTFTETGNEYEIYKNPTNTITYDANGGTGTVPDSQTKQYGHRIQVASSRLTRANYSFKGWSKNSSATTPTYKPGEYYIDNADTTLYAVWSADELVLYDNGVFCEESGPMVKNSNNGGTFSTNYNDTDKDDTCVYFYRSTNDGYAKGRMATTNPIDVTPYDKITITYRYIAEYSDAGIRGECLFGLSETPTPDISGNSSAGTNFKNACVASGGRNWASSSGSTIRTTEIDISNISGSYYFTWFLQNYNDSVYGYLYSVVLSQEEKITIEYDANGGENAPEPQTKEPGVNITLATAQPTKEGNTFLGWSTNSSATTAEYQPGAEYTQDMDLELFAVWSENYLTVNYYSNYATESFSGAANTVTSSTNVIVRTYKFYYATAYSTGLHNYSASGNGTYLARTGYTATGKWGTSASGGTLVDEDTSFTNGQSLAEAFGKDLTNGNESIDVYAQWTAKTVVVTFNKNDGSGTTATQTFTYGVSGQSFSNKNWTRNGYELLGWSKSSTATTASWSTLSGVSNDWINTNSPSITIYAVWKLDGTIIKDGVEVIPCKAQRYTATVSRTLNDGYITISANNSWYENTLIQADGCYRLTDKLDLTNINKITLKVLGTTGSSGYVGTFNFYVTQQREDMYSSYASSYYCPAIVTVNGAGEYVLDVSELSGEYWVGLHLKCNGPYSGDSCTATISDMWYE